MGDIYCFSYVEDEPSAAVARRLVAYRNAHVAKRLVFREGFPAIVGGCNEIKKKCAAFLNMARAGSHTFTVTDLDRDECACALIRDWFAIPTDHEVNLPNECIFRVAVREVEAWILADRTEWSAYLGIGAANFSTSPDDLVDPKQHLLNVIRRKGRRKLHREMLPRGNAHIGPRYNEVLRDFIDTRWSPERASAKSPSLQRAMSALLRV